jgi:hypothetical protein
MFFSPFIEKKSLYLQVDIYNKYPLKNLQSIQMCHHLLS